MSRLTPSLLVLDKGLDLQTAKILAPEGSVFDSLNYEQVDFQGQKRIDGYARYDGTLLPAFDEYYILTFTPGGCWNGFPEGVNTNLFANGKLWAVAIKNANLDGNEAYIQILDHSLEVLPGASLSINGTTIGVVVSVVEGKSSGVTIQQHYDNLLDLASTVKSRVTTLPTPVAGLHWFKDRLYAVAGVQTFKGGMLLAGSLSDVCAGTPIDYSLTLYGGSPPVTISKLAGPADMTISTTGQIEWNRPLPGTYSVLAEAVDTFNNSTQWEASFQVVPITWNFTTWQNSTGYSSPYGAGKVIWSDYWQRYISCTGPGRKLSDDGITWATAGTVNYFGVAENPDTHRVVVVQAEGQIYTSDDGAQTVTLRTTSSNLSAVSMKFVNGQFVANTNTRMVVGGADGETWTEGPSFNSVLGSGPDWEYIDHLGIYLFVNGFDGTTGTATSAFGPYTSAGTIPGWTGNTYVRILYSSRLQRTFITAGGVIRERLDDGTYVVRLPSVGQSITDIIEIPEMGALVATCSGSQPSTSVSLDGGTTWTRYNGLNSFRLMAWSPVLSRLVAIGQNVASYANGSCAI